MLLMRASRSQQGTTLAIDRTLDALGHVAQRHGGTLRRLADGSALILLATSGPPTDLAA